MGRLLKVDPGELFLPPSRKTGADPFKLSEQIRQYGDQLEAMPPVQVTQTGEGDFMINDGVTRAIRIAKLRPGATIVIEVIDERPSWSLAHLPRVRERL